MRSEKVFKLYTIWKSIQLTKFEKYLITVF